MRKNILAVAAGEALATMHIFYMCLKIPFMGSEIITLGTVEELFLSAMHDFDMPIKIFLNNRRITALSVAFEYLFIS